MSVETLLLLMVVMVVGYFILSLYKIQGRIWCTFRRPDKTKFERWVKETAKKVRVEGKEYNINPKYIQLLRWRRGIFQFFPILVPSLDFTWTSPNPQDPEDFQVTWDTPEARDARRGEESWVGFSRGVQRQLATKARFPDWLFPAIIVGAILIVGYLVYQLSGQVSYLQQIVIQSSGGG